MRRKIEGVEAIKAPQIRVLALSARAARGMVAVGNLRFSCALGRGGSRAVKREGDGATPLGRFELTRAFYRGDRLRRPRTGLPLACLKRDDGWCDAPSDRNYNRFVRHPYPASAERLWRQDGLYDLVVVLSYNERPRIKGAGSAIFMHVAGPGWRPTEGCVAVRRGDLVKLLGLMRRRSSIRVGR